MHVSSTFPVQQNEFEFSVNFIVAGIVCSSSMYNTATTWKIRLLMSGLDGGGQIMIFQAKHKIILLNAMHCYRFNYRFNTCCYS